MSLRSAAIVVPEAVPGPICGVRKMLTRLQGDDLDWFEEHLPASSGCTAEYISEVLKKDGIWLSGSTIARHRKGKCHCAAA